MPVRDEFRLYLLDQMREAHGGVTSRRMFGGLGLYADGLFFGVVDDDVLYLKVDPANPSDAERRAQPAFAPMGAPMSYHLVPGEVLDDTARLRDWVAQALAAAAHAGRRKAARPAAPARRTPAARRAPKSPAPAPRRRTPRP
ncbi:MAG: TfoX/Sxy family protein [Acidobacteria bacterium]|nr:TfoX/Sxy family protein [Acidobacteriota bacterium]